MRYALIGLGGAIAVLWGLAYLFSWPTTTDEGRIRFNDELIISYRITSEGGALGQERYEAFALHGGKREKFFEGVSGSQFGLSKGAPDLILLRFCNGEVENLSLIGSTPHHGLIHVQPILYCPEPREGGGA